MKSVILLDSGPLGEIIKPQLDPRVRRWAAFIKEQKISLRIAEINDYEVRRNCILEKFEKSISNLNKYRQRKQFIPIDSEMMLDACELWAWIRRDKQQPTADRKQLDGDTILVAQALSQKKFFDRVIIVTENSKHFIRFAEYDLYTWEWKQALVDCIYGEINLCSSDFRKLS
jgi:toxin FitB